MKKSLIILFILLCNLSLALSQPIDVIAEKPFEPVGHPLEGLVITIDPGHGGFSHTGGYSGSARGVNSRAVEQDLNMLVAGELYQHLRSAGANVYITRQDDRKVTLGDTIRADELGARVQMAVQTHSHLFLSLHHNSDGRTADGVVLMIDPTDSKGKDQPLEREFARILREEVQKQVHHGKEFNFFINNHPLVSSSDIPSATVEFGFLTNPDFDAWVTQRDAHCKEAIGAYNGILRMWQEHRAELEALRKQLFKKELLKETKKVNRFLLTPEQEYQQDLTALMEELWKVKHPPLNSKEAQSIIDGYKKLILTDATLFYLNTTVEKKSGKWILKGSANFPFLKITAENLLKKAGCNKIQNEIVLLPSDKVGEEKYGVVQIPMALTWSAPSEHTSVQTQLLFGERVFVLDINSDTTYYLVHGGDGYIGWVRKEAVLLMDTTTFVEWEKAPRALFIHDYMQDELRFPTGAMFPILSYNTTSSVTLRLPRGFRATGNQNEVTVPLDVLQLPSTTSIGRSAALTALEYLTVPYVFGAKSKLGLDCSGLTDMAYASVGLTLPRDAKQQILVGQLVSTPWHRDNLQPGDLLFFCDDLGKVSHTGVSLGGHRFIHASPPEVQVSSFDSTDPLYDENWDKHFVLAKRPLGE